MAKRGPKPKPVFDEQGKVIEGLKRDGNRYYSNYFDEQGKKRRRNHGSDLQEAIKDYYSFLNSTSEATAEITTRIAKHGQPTVAIDSKLRKAQKSMPVTGFGVDEEGWYSETLIDEKAIFAFVEKVIKENPLEAAKKLNIPEIARLSYLPAPLKELKLSSILSDFCEHKQFRRDKHDKADISMIFPPETRPRLELVFKPSCRRNSDESKAFQGRRDREQATRSRCGNRPGTDRRGGV